MDDWDNVVLYWNPLVLCWEKIVFAKVGNNFIVICHNERMAISQETI